MDTSGSNSKPLLSILLLAHNEAKNLLATTKKIVAVLDRAAIPLEVVVVNDHSKDNTTEIIKEISKEDPRIKLIENKYPNGYGYALRCGLEAFTGDAVVIAMADASDDPADIIKYYTMICRGYECVFGTRFCNKARVINYPLLKLVLNRLGNLFIQTLFWIPYNDITNAFKCYSRTAIEGMSPLISCHFNLTVEMPLKAIIRGYKWTVVPTNWFGRTGGISKWHIQEMGSRYLFIILYLWLEKLLSRNDYYRDS
jgi:dolichol-phosphate mannosyltransferase